jgi:beta-galactosidase
MRKTISLNFDWHFVPSFSENFIIEKDILPDSKKVEIPHTVKELPLHHFDESEYQIESTYQLHFSVDESEKGNNLFLRFGGVMTTAKVYLNQFLLGFHEGGYTPFSYDVTNKVLFNTDNILLVKVDSNEIKDIPPFGNVVDYLGYGGIYREVWIDVLPKTYIEKCIIKTRESVTLVENEMNLDYTLKINHPIDNSFELTVTLYDGLTPVFIEKTDEKSTDLLLHSFLYDNVIRWSIDNPKLYRFEATIKQNNHIIDTISERFGFRDAKFSSEGFALNNKKVKLIGLNRHQSYPYVGYAMPKRMQEKDADILKYECGCNIVRCSHYMQSDHFINRCDEIGLLVFEEIPGWQYIGNEHFKELSLQNLEVMILHHINHPSIILWGTRINESSDDHDFYTLLSERAFELDDSRQIGGVRNLKNSELLEDVYTYNDFSHIGNNPGLENPRKVSHAVVPYLVSEHNGHIFPTKKFDPESKRTEQALRHMAVIDSAFKYESISGAIGWCLADYNTHKDFGSGDRVCYHGVTDMFRIPKYAAYAYLSQQRQKPVLMVASNMNIGEYSRSVIEKAVVFTNCDYIKFYHNDEFIDTIYSSWHQFPHVPYAPIIITDFIGKQLEDSHEYSKSVAKKIKKALLSYNKYGFQMPLLDKLRFLNLILIHNFTMEDAMDIYGKYLGNWGSTSSSYRFDGYIQDQLVISKSRGQSHKFTLVAEIDSQELQHDFTYDVTRIVVKLVDEYENVYPYGDETLQISTSDNLDIIGPKSTSLIGGSVGIYVKSKALGRGFVQIDSNFYPSIKLKVEVK